MFKLLYEILRVSKYNLDLGSMHGFYAFLLGSIRISKYFSEVESKRKDDLLLF